MTKYLLMMLAAFCFLASPAFAQEEDAKPKEEAQEAQEEKQELSEAAQMLADQTKEWAAVDQKFRKMAIEIQKKIREEGGGQEELMEAYQEFQANMKKETTPILTKVMKIAEMAKEDADASMDAVSFIMNNANDEEMTAKVTEIALKHHLDHEKLPQLLTGLQGGLPSKETFDFLTAVIEKSTNEVNQGTAALAQTGMVEQLIQFAPMVKDNPQIAEQAPGLVKLIESFEEDELTDEGLLTRMESVVEKFGDVKVNNRTVEKTIARKIKAVRTRAQTAVGKVAPEIEGTDIDGTNFKLSDYRGKVVMLDFWGDW